MCRAFNLPPDLPPLTLILAGILSIGTSRLRSDRSSHIYCVLIGKHGGVRVQLWQASHAEAARYLLVCGTFEIQELGLTAARVRK